MDNNYVYDEKCDAYTNHHELTHIILLIKKNYEVIDDNLDLENPRTVFMLINHCYIAYPQNYVNYKLNSQYSNHNHQIKFE
jgi:hypothetical protein